VVSILLIEWLGFKSPPTQADILVLDFGPTCMHIPDSQHVWHLIKNNSCVSMEAGLIKINLCLNSCLVDYTNSLHK